MSVRRYLNGKIRKHINVNSVHFTPLLNSVVSHFIVIIMFMIAMTFLSTAPKKYLTALTLKARLTKELRLKEMRHSGLLRMSQNRYDLSKLSQ